MKIKRKRAGTVSILGRLPLSTSKGRQKEWGGARSTGVESIEMGAFQPGAESIPGEPSSIKKAKQKETKPQNQTSYCIVKKLQSRLFWWGHF